MNLEVVVLIPALNPDSKLITYVNNLIKKDFKKIIIVNDGSNKKCDKYFEKLKDKKECIILKHDTNLGKGKALKTGFEYYKNKLKNYKGIVTADCDGQHSPEDTFLVAKTLIESNNFILGTRNFNDTNVPFKSKYGNKITSFIFKNLYKKAINDTQTGLRGIPNSVIEKIMNLDGDRFEYEINVLIEVVTNNIKITEIPIKTIYIENNKSSHFKPLKDALKIYLLLFKGRKK